MGIKEVKLPKASRLVSGHTVIWASTWVTQKCHYVSGYTSGEGLSPEGLCVWAPENVMQALEPSGPRIWI